MHADNIPIQEGEPLSKFVEAGRPEWNFARTMGHDVCWPQPAFLPPDDHANPGVGVKPWPRTNQDACPNTGGGFPTYWVAKKCSDDEIRVSYTLYIPNSCFIGCAHGDEFTDEYGRHDFEGVVVVWRRDGTDWTRSSLLLSQHADYQERAWPEAESWYLDWSSAGLGRNHPRIFVGWGSHAMFNDQEVSCKDIASQGNGNEYRNAHYSHHDYVLREVTETNDLGKRFQGALDDDKLGGEGLRGNPLLLTRSICGLEGSASPLFSTPGGASCFVGCLNSSAHCCMQILRCAT